MIDRFGLLPDAARNLFDVTELKLHVQSFGIRKIEAGPVGGKIHFDAEPKIDPMHMITLVQTKPDTFKLDGSERLRFFADLAAPEQRTQNVRSLLDQLLGMQ